VLVQKRIQAEYRQLERMGSQLPALVQAASGGSYVPNASSSSFDLEKLIADLDPDKRWRTPGHATGGRSVSGDDALRAARLARFGGAGPTAGSPPPAATTAPPSSRWWCGGAAEEQQLPSPPPPAVERQIASGEGAAFLQREDTTWSTPSSAPPLPPPTSTGLPAAISVEEDARLAWRLQAEEGFVASPQRSPPPPAAAPQQQTDEELARALQEEEEARARGGRGGGGRGGVRSGPRSGRAAGGGGTSGGGRGYPGGGGGGATTAAQRGGGDPLLSVLQNVGLVAQQMDQSFRLFGSEFQRTVQEASQPGGLPAGAPPVAQELVGALNRFLAGGTGPQARGATAQAVSASTTVMTFEGSSADGGDGNAGGEGQQCMVCLENFQAGDQLRVLPCLHRFHVACIDPWLQRNCKCPSCNHTFGPGSR